MLHSGDRRLPAALLVVLLAAPLMPAATADEPLGPYTVETIPSARLALTGNSTTVALSDDVVTFAIPLGFSSRFFGRATSEFWIGSNGFITLHFLTPDGCCQGEPLPSTSGPNGIIAGWWTDLDPSNGSIRFERVTLGGQRALVVDYENVTVKGTADTATFQIVLLQDGVFEIHVQHGAAQAGRRVVVGAENRLGTVGVSVLDQLGGTIDGAAWRFTPNVVPLPPPVLLDVVPRQATMGALVRAVGTNFSDLTEVQVGGFSTSTFFDNETSLFFSVPFLGTGVFNVSVVNPDGNSSTLVGGLEIIAPFGISFVQPSSVRQGDTVFVFGSGFDEATTLLFDDVLMEHTSEFGSLLRVELPTTFRPGLYDVTVHKPSEGRRTMQDALVVEGRPDLAIEAITVAREQVGLAAAPVGLPGQVRVDVAFANLGDASASLATLNLTATPRENGVTPASVYAEEFELGEIAPGERGTMSFFVGDQYDVGDWSYVARIRSLGVGDRDASNDVAAKDEAYLVTGFGADLTPCLVVSNVCMPPERVHHELVERNQTDTHLDAFFRLDARMETPQFTFDDFPIVFTTFTPLGNGGFEECTTWRFLGDGGLFRVTMDAPNGLEGLLDVGFARSSASNGTQRTTTWTDVRAFGVILTEDERQSSATEPSQPLTEYVYEESPDLSWEVTGTGLRGDFTHCAFRPQNGESHDEFFFHALPANTLEETASRTGFGHAETLTVRVLGASDTETQMSLL